jgi:hypothetical protein
MSEFIDALTDAEVDLQKQVPKTFTVDGLSGSFACITDVRNASESLSVGGMRGEDGVTMSFLRTVSYSPTVGDEITVDGLIWVVDSLQCGPVKWEVSLKSKHE